MPVTKKTVRGISEQRENESRRLWKEVTAGLKLNDIEKATNAKTSLEQKQRDEAKKRKEMNLEWETKVSILNFSPFLYFAKHDENLVIVYMLLAKFLVFFYISHFAPQMFKKTLRKILCFSYVWF